MFHVFHICDIVCGDRAKRIHMRCTNVFIQVAAVGAKFVYTWQWNTCTHSNKFLFTLRQTPLKHMLHECCNAIMYYVHMYILCVYACVYVEHQTFFPTWSFLWCDIALNVMHFHTYTHFIAFMFLVVYVSKHHYVSSRHSDM